MAESGQADVVWTGVGCVYGRSVSADGRWLTYADWVPFDLHLYDLEMDVDRRLTDVRATDGWTGMAMEARVSPDGTRVAYGWWGAHYDLRVGRVDDPIEAMARPFGRTSWAAIHDWSADGRSVLLTDFDKARTIVYDVESGASSEVATGPVDETAGSRLFVAPDGKRIACSVRRPGAARTAIVVRPVDDVEPDMRVAGDSHDLLFGWSPDGDEIVFASDRGGTIDLYAVDASPGSQEAPRLLRRDIATNLEPLAVTTDGSCFFIASASRTSVYEAAIDSSTSVIGALRTVDAAAGDQTSVDWSPDGSVLAYTRDCGPHFTFGFSRCVVFVGEAATWESPSLAAGTYPGSHPMKLWWSPTGDSLIGAGFIGDGNQRGLYAVDATTGAVRPLATVGVVTGGPRESVAPLPDADEIVYRRVDAPFGRGGQVLVVRRLHSGDERVIYSNEPDETISHVTASRDGSRVAFLSSSEIGVEEQAANSRIKVVPTAGGPAQIIVSCEAPESISTLAWTPDGESILFGRQRGAADSEVLDVLRVSVAGGDTQHCGLRLDNATLFAMRVHPSGRRVALSAGRLAAGEVRVLRNCV